MSHAQSSQKEKFGFKTILTFSITWYLFPKKTALTAAYE